VAEKLRRAVAAAAMPGPDGQAPLSVTISIGVATLAVDAEDVAGLIERRTAPSTRPSASPGSRRHRASPPARQRMTHRACAAGM